VTRTDTLHVVQYENIDENHSRENESTHDMIIHSSLDPPKVVVVVVVETARGVRWKCSSRDWNVGGMEAALNQTFSFVSSVLRGNWLYEHTTWTMGSFSNHLHCENFRNTSCVLGAGTSLVNVNTGVFSLQKMLSAVLLAVIHEFLSYSTHFRFLDSVLTVYLAYEPFTSNFCSQIYSIF